MTDYIDLYMMKGSKHMDREVFIGTGHNPDGPDLPLGFGMQLAQEPKALQAYGNLSNSEKETVINYIQSSTSGDDAKNRIMESISRLKDNPRDSFF